MPPNSLNDNSAYNSNITLDLDKLKNGQTKTVKVDLTKVNIITLTSQIYALSEDVKLYMKLLTSRGYYASNDRTINLLTKGDVDMSATTSETYYQHNDIEGKPGFSDAELSRNINKEREAEVFITENNTRAGGSFFPYLNIAIFDLSKYGILKNS